MGLYHSGRQKGGYTSVKRAASSGGADERSHGDEIESGNKIFISKNILSKRKEIMGENTHTRVTSVRLGG